MTLLGVIGILLGLLAWPYAAIERTRLRAAVFVLAWLVHALMGFVFYAYSLANITDSSAYYYDHFNFYGQGIGAGTVFITWIVQAIKATVGGSFLDYFLIFQAFGFFGIALFMRIFEEVFIELEVKQPLYIYGLFFLPGMHFWTSAIGKDGLIFTGVCLTLWAAMNVRRRWVWMGLGILLVLIIRPHVALVMAAAVTGTILLDRATGMATRIFLVVAAVLGMIVSLSTIQSTFSIDLTNADSISDYLAAQEQIVTTEDAGNTMVAGNFVVKLVSLLFRPFFIDGEGLFGLLVSVENLVLLIVVGTLLWHLRDTVALLRRVTFLRFAAISGAGLIVMLTLMYYNIGLGLRQKTMFVPSLLLLYAVLIGIRKARQIKDVGLPPAVQLAPLPTAKG